jgi:tripartite-type tricarboxylate transporter receptor subunit TctC
VKAGFVSTAGVIQHVRDGKLKGLAISAAARSALAPDVPTTAEAGYPDFKLGTYFVLLAPAGTPDTIAEQLERAVRAVLASPDLKEKFRPQDIEVVGSDAAAARAFLREDSALWARIARDANLRVD